MARSEAAVARGIYRPRRGKLSSSAWRNHSDRPNGAGKAVVARRSVPSLGAGRQFELTNIFQSGENLIGWGSHFFCKLPHDGKRVSWHQDASYWPLTPSKAITAWLAIDDADVGNACMRFIPGSHVLGHLTYTLTENDDANVLNQAVASVENLGAPVDDFALMTLLAFRFIPTLIGDAETLINQAHHTWKAASRHVVVLKARWYVLTHGDAAIGNLADHVDRELVSQYLAKQPTCRQRIDMAAAEELAWARYRHISERYDFAKEHDRDQIKRGELLPRGFTKPPRPRVRHAYKFGT